MGNCECGWLLSQQNTCGNPNHDQALLITAAERALAYLRDWHCDNQRDVIEELARALGKSW